MSVLENLEPKSVFRYFEEMSQIPHGSFHTKAVSDWVVEFAKAKGLRYRQDDANNVVIFKPATPGYENAPTVMLQGHLDMVCEKEADCMKDMDTEGLDLFIEGDRIGARGTTLGGDDGIAVAMAMAILEAEDIPHGPLECLFTTDEEVGMLGAEALDASDLHAECLLNLDSEEEGILTVSCAGSSSVHVDFPVKREPFAGTVCRVKVSGLCGGHSGAEIHKGRANADILLGRVLSAMEKTCELRLIAASGGNKENAIPREAWALISVSDYEAVAAVAAEETAALKGEYRTIDDGVQVTLEPAEDDRLPMDAAGTRSFVCFLFCVPNGVQAMSAEVPGLVQTSSNLGILRTLDDTLRLQFMARSSVNTRQQEICRLITTLAEALGGTAEVPVTNGAWEYKPDSALRDTLAEVYREQYGKEPIVTAIHAGLECGVLSAKLPGLDCVSIGPNMDDIHTPGERLYISSVGRTWELVLETLKRLK